MTQFPLPPWRIDPYFVWAYVTDYAYWQPAGTGGYDTVLLEAKTSLTQLKQWAKGLQQELAAKDRAPYIVITEAFLELPKPETRKICTAQIHREFLKMLSRYYSTEGDQRPPKPVADFWDNVERIELSANVSPAGFEKGEFTNGATWVDPAETARRTVLGIVDVGCPYANDGWRTRVRALWDQNLGRSKLGSAVPYGFGYGREWVAPTSQALIPPSRDVEKESPEKRVCAEQKSYSEHEFPLLARSCTHGAAVLGEFSNENLVPHAEHAEIMIAELPEKVVAYTARAALSAHVYHGMAWILLRGRSADGKPKARFVVNVSMGTTAGPHDGTSILEAAFDELVEAYTEKPEGEHLAIVLAAGNSYEAQVHAEFDLKLNSSMRHVAQLKWRVLPDDVTPSYVELWFPKEASAGDKPCVKLTSPSGTSVTAPLGSAAGIGTRTEALVVFPWCSAGGAGLMALVALAPTATGDARIKTTDAGVWTIEISADKAINGVHAYVERDNAMFDPSRPKGRQSYFLDEAYVPAGTLPGVPQDDQNSNVKRTGTLSSLATGKRTVVVGAYVHTKDKRPSAYSSCGPLRGSPATRPHVVAVGDDATGQAGVNVCGTYSGTVTRLSGTSISAPQVAGLIAGAMSNGEIGALQSAADWLSTAVSNRTAKVGVEPSFPQIGGGRIGRYGRDDHP